MQKIVITGASGFVGRALVSHFSEIEVDVVPVSRKECPNFVTVKTYFDCPGGDLLIHLAEEPDRAKANALGLQYKEESIALTRHLSSLFSGKVIYLSSSVVYGDKNSLPNCENSLVYETDNYSAIKIQNEKVVTQFGGTALRMANLYGSGMSANNVMSDIIKQIDTSGPLQLRNTSPVRDFLFIEDLVSAVSLLTKKPFRGILNIGSGEGVSIKQLAEIILRLSNAKKDVISTEISSATSINVLDISKISELLQWRPSATLEEHMVRLIQSGVLL